MILAPITSPVFVVPIMYNKDKMFDFNIVLGECPPLVMIISTGNLYLLSEKVLLNKYVELSYLGF